MLLPPPEEPGLDSQGSDTHAAKVRDWFKRAWLRRTCASRRVLIAGGILGAILLAALITLGVSYRKYSHLIDARLADGPFRDAVNIYASPLILSVGDQMTPEDLQAELHEAGFEATPGKNIPAYKMLPDGVEIFPSGASASSLRVYIAKDQIARLTTRSGNVNQSALGTPLITTLSSHDSSGPNKQPKNEERLLVTFSSIPPVLVHAIVSVEDKRFFRHKGLDLRRVVKAAYVDVKDRRKAEGASTLTMQLVRGLWLEPDKLWMRKVAEAMMTVHLEHEWTKEKIFETYVNQVYLGRQAAYNIHGFGEGSRLFFGRELRDIDLPQAALLAGLVQRPSYFNPFRNPERARERRDLVLRLMLENKYITRDQYDRAVNTPVRVASGALSEARAPWFLDLINNELQNRESDDGDPARSVYTTIDLRLQRAAEQAVTIASQEIDKLVAKRGVKDGAKPEVALIALDPHTGEIKALVGGRDYGRSQLNRVLSLRPPGSVFKPFVYAAALNTALSGGETVYTPATTVNDAPVKFLFDGKSYQPGNFKNEIFGTLTLREALAKSDNVAAVKVAQGVGYQAVVQMARSAGLNDGIQPTPSVALGAYQVTPLEMAGAYTVFANGGMWVQPRAISSYRDGEGEVLPGVTPVSHEALDPRTNWLMVSMLEEVMRSGTAAGVRSRGFTLPAAGKTGTAHDGWFAGFTSQLLCIVWVGYDDYRELKLEGAKSALPIWTEFMKRASHVGAYRNAKEFPMPQGIESAKICLDSGKLAGDQCPRTRNEYFIAGSEPGTCDMHGAPAPDSDTSPFPTPAQDQPQ
ncbi:MAG: PBP1A family penicillin-binding protein [Acidobacteriota bacterium]|nr:PBP1A family penicillin-binding protein [Acidobacteriota bacterium]